MPRKTTPVRWKLMVDYFDGRDTETMFEDRDKAHKAFLKLVRNPLVETCYVYSYDMSGNTMLRVWHYESNA